jgi:hypothetical protein
MLHPTKQYNKNEDGRVYTDLQVLITLQHKASGFRFSTIASIAWLMPTGSWRDVPLLSLPHAFKFSSHL